MNLTDHSVCQAKKRYNLSRVDLHILAGKAYNEGDEIEDEVKHLYYNKTSKIPPDTIVIYYEDIIYIFGTAHGVVRLVTLFTSTVKQNML